MYEFVYDPTAGILAVIEEITPSGSVYYVREPEGLIIALIESGEVKCYHFDALGSTRLLTDGSGNMTDTYAYDAWGNLTARTGSTAQPYEFVGQLGYYTHYQDANMRGLLQLGVRFYDPTVGRFTQRDQVKVDGEGEYNYVGDVPTRLQDPTGLCPPAAGAIVVGGVVIGLEELALGLSAIAVIVCGQDEECREALMNISEDVAKWAKTLKDQLKNCLKKIKCKVLKEKPDHWWPRPSPKPPFVKKCYMWHIRIICTIQGVGNIFNEQFPFGPCYKYRNGKGGVTH